MALNSREETWKSIQPFHMSFEKNCLSVCLPDFFFENADARDLGPRTLFYLGLGMVLGLELE